MSFKNYLQSQDKSKSTIQYTQYYVLDFLSWLDQDGTEAENTTAKEIMSYLQHLQKKGLSDPSRAVRLNALNHYFDYLIEKEGTLSLSKGHPCKHIKIRGAHQIKLTPALSRENLEKIYLNYQIPTAADPRGNKNWFTCYKQAKQRNKTILSLLIHQALTTTEINRLKIKDVRLREGEIYITGSRKSNERTLSLKPNQIMDLMEYIYQVRPELGNYQINEQTDLLFLPTPVVGKKSGANSLNIWKRLAEEIKEQHPQFIKFQQIRTSVITHWLKHHNLRQVQYMAGHKHVSTTERYLLNQTEDLLKDIDQYHPLS